MAATDWMAAELRALREQALDRHLQVYPETGGVIREGEQTWLNFASNDYLSLARSPILIAAAEQALHRWGVGATASRLVSGTLPCHEELERRLAAYKHYPAALVFGSGFLVNAGIVPALVGRGDRVIADRLAHASLLDGIALSRAEIRRFQHNDVQHLADLLKKSGSAKRTLIITESVFSMDGDLAPLVEIAAVAQRHGAMLLVDEAHATGVFGPAGAGCIHAMQLESSVDVAMGTLSKALGGYGGFVACAQPVKDWLVNRARSFIYSTALPPVMVAAASAALNFVQQQIDLGRQLLGRAQKFRDHLRRAGLDTGRSASQIIPIIVGTNERALALARCLETQNIRAVAIRPPTVPAGTARLRLSVTLAHSEADLERAAEIIIESARAEGIL